MTDDSIFLAFGLVLACAAAVCASISALLCLGFFLGVAVTLVAGAIASAE
jgi:hypothetical protein